MDWGNDAVDINDADAYPTPPRRTPNRVTPNAGDAPGTDAEGGDTFRYRRPQHIAGLLRGRTRHPWRRRRRHPTRRE